MDFITATQHVKKSSVNIQKHQDIKNKPESLAYLDIVSDEDLSEVEYLQHGGCIVVADAVAL